MTPVGARRSSVCVCECEVVTVCFLSPGSLPQVFLTSLPPVAAQIPVSAVQLHPVTSRWLAAPPAPPAAAANVSVCPQMVISQQSSSSSSSNLTELQVVSLDVHQSKED